MTDLSRLRHRLAQAHAALEAAPENVELITVVRHLECALEALEGWQTLCRRAARGRLLLIAHESRN